MTENDYKFRLKTNLFEIEISGDRGFVEKMINRYEARYMNSFKKLLAEPETDTKQDAPPSPVKQQDSPNNNKTPTPEETQKRKPFSKKRRSSKYQGKYASQHSEQASTASTKESDNADSKSEPVVPGENKQGGVDAAKPVSSEEKEPDPDRPATPKPRSRKQRPKKRSSESGTGGKAPESAKHKALSEEKINVLNKLFNSKDPKTHQEKVLLFGYFLDKECSISTFETVDVEECYKAVNIASPRNLNLVISHAMRTGFVTRNAKGRKIFTSLTSKAKQFVENNFQSFTPDEL